MPTLTRTTSIGTTVEVVYEQEGDDLVRITSYRRRQRDAENYGRRVKHMADMRCTLAQLTGEETPCPTL